METRRWARTQLSREDAKRFKEYCRDMHLQYEASEADNLIHFEVYVSQREEQACNDFLSKL